MTGTGKEDEHSHVASEEDVKEFYAAYISPDVGGKDDLETFKKNLQVFFDFTFDAYIFGDCDPHGDRKQSFAKFVNHIKASGANKPRQKAFCYFCAVDKVHPYT